MVSNLSPAPTFAHELFPTTTAIRIDLNPGASGISTICISATDYNNAGHICYLTFGPTVNTTAITSDVQLTGNNVYRFSFARPTKWLSLKLDSGQTNPFGITYYIEGKNE